MQHLSIKSIALGFVLATFFWGICFVLLEIEYEVPRAEGWPPELIVKENPITQNRRVIDSEVKATVFWSSGNPPILPVEIKKVSPNRWSAIFEKAY